MASKTHEKLLPATEISGWHFISIELIWNVRNRKRKKSNNKLYFFPILVIFQDGKIGVFSFPRLMRRTGYSKEEEYIIINNIIKVNKFHFERKVVALFKDHKFKDFFILAEILNKQKVDFWWKCHFQKHLLVRLIATGKQNLSLQVYSLARLIEISFVCLWNEAFYPHSTYNIARFLFFVHIS